MRRYLTLLLGLFLFSGSVMAAWDETGTLVGDGTDGNIVQVTQGRKMEDSGSTLSSIAGTNWVSTNFVKTVHTGDVEITGKLTATQLAVESATADDWIWDEFTGRWLYLYHGAITNTADRIFGFYDYGGNKGIAALSTLDMMGHSITNIGTNSLQFTDGSKISVNGDDFYYTSSDGATTNDLTGKVDSSTFVAGTNTVTGAFVAADDAVTNWVDGLFVKTNYSGNINISGLVEADSFKLGPISATVTNIFDSDSISSNALLTAAETQRIIANTLTGNEDIYMQSTKTFSFTNYFGPTNYTYLATYDEDEIGTKTTLTIPSLTSGAYLFAFGDTNKNFTRISGQSVNGVVFISENAAGSVQGKMEVYRRDVATGALEEWGEGGDEFTITDSVTPQRVQFSVPVAGITTNAFELWARFKRTGGTASGKNMLVGVGTGAVTRITFTVSADILLEPYQTISGFIAGTNTVTDAFVAADAVKANTNHYGEIVASRFKGRITVLDEGDSTPTWDATNTFSTLNVTQNVTITISNFEAGITYAMRIYNNASKTIAWDSAVDWIDDELAELNTNVISFISFDGSVLFASGKAY